jgi:hypothetical protein
MAARRRWIPIVLGAGVLLVFVGIAAIIAVAAWFQQNVEVSEGSSEQDAQHAFDEVRQRFGGRSPVLVLRDGRPEYSGGERPPDTATPGSLTTLQVLAWDATDRQLARVTVPFWLLRLKRGPIQFGTYASGLDARRINLTADDLEKFGAGILIDTDGPRGSHVIVWTQ